MAVNVSGLELTVEQAYRRYFPIIRERCRRVLRDDQEAQDVAQETFLRFWGRGPVHADTRTVVSWIYRTGLRLAIDRLRRRRHSDTFEEAINPMSLATAAGNEEAALRCRRALELIAARVPVEELELVVLSRVDRMTHEEIAMVMGISDRTVRRVLQRFDLRLHKLGQEVRP